MVKQKKENQSIRLAVAFILTSALVGLAIYGGRVLSDAHLRYRHCLSLPEANHGKHLLLNCVRLGDVAAGCFFVMDGEDRLKVEGDPGVSPFAGRISLEAVFQRDGRLVLVRSYHHRWRPFKIVVSILAALFVAVFLFINYRLDLPGGYLVARGLSHAPRDD